MKRLPCFAVAALAMAGCSHKRQNPLLGDWDIVFSTGSSSSASFFTGMKAYANFDENGTITMRVDYDLSATGSMFGGSSKPATSSKPNMVHSTSVGTYTLKEDTLTLRMFEQQTQADDPRMQKMYSGGKGFGAKEMSTPQSSKIVWNSSDEFKLMWPGYPVTFRRSRHSIF